MAAFPAPEHMSSQCGGMATHNRVGDFVLFEGELSGARTVVGKADAKDIGEFGMVLIHASPPLIPCMKMDTRSWALRHRKDFLRYR